MRPGALGGGLSPFTSTLGRPRVSASMIDKCAIVSISACVFALIIFPLLLFFTYSDIHTLEGRPEPRIFWPAMAAISVVLTAQNRSRLTLPPNIICLLAYLAFAGASVLWASAWSARSH